MLIFLLIMGLIILGMFANGDYGVAFGLLAIIVGGVVAFFVWLHVSDSRERERKKEREKEERAREVERGLQEAISDSRKCFRDLKRYHRLATKALDGAEGYFNDGVYSPFWDEVEKAALALGRFSESVRDLSNKLQDYLGWVAIYDGIPDAFPVTSEQFAALPQPNALSNRMRNIVHAAQRDFHFASIFEQRKTQKLLVAGFESFADVLNDVGNQITDHVEYLNTTVQTYNEEMASLMESAATQREQHHDELMKTINKDSDK